MVPGLLCFGVLGFAWFCRVGRFFLRGCAWWKLMINLKWQKRGVKHGEKVDLSKHLGQALSLVIQFHRPSQEAKNVGFRDLRRQDHWDF